MAYSPKGIGNQIFMKQIYERYSHLGARNFLTYAYKAAKAHYSEGGILKQGMNSPAIRKQLKNHFEILKGQLEEKNVKWYSYKNRTSKKKVSIKEVG